MNNGLILTLGARVFLTKGPSYNSKLLLQTDLDQFPKSNSPGISLKSNGNPSLSGWFEKTHPSTTPLPAAPIWAPLCGFVPSSRYAPRDLENPGFPVDSASEAGELFGMCHLKKTEKWKHLYKEPPKSWRFGWLEDDIPDFTWVMFRVNQSLIVRGVDEHGILKCLINYSTIPRKALLVDIHGLCPCWSFRV